MKKLLIDLEKVAEHANCSENCSYFYHPKNRGIASLIEFANFALVCRKCEDAPCVAACRFNALEKKEDKVLKRYLFKCVSCKSCSYACHSGVILPESIPFMASTCDWCIGRLSGNEFPVCVKGCTCGAVQYGDFEADESKNIYAINDNLLVHSIHWAREEAKA